jgi:hypothetical protein
MYCRTIIGAVLLAIFTAGIAQATPTVDLGTASGSQCNQVTVAITLTNDNLAAVAAAATDIGYNSTYLTPVNAAIGPAGSAAGKSVAANIVSPGVYRVGVFSSSNMNTIGNGIIANVTFEINCSAPATSYQLGNSPSASTAAGNTIDVTGNSGTITVGAAVTTTTTAARVPVEHIKSCNVCHPSAYDSQLSLAYHAHPSHVSDCFQCHDTATGAGTVHLRPGKTCATCHPQSSTGICNLTTLAAHSGGNCLTCHVDCDTNDSNNHISTCVTCHPTDFSSASSLKIHGRTGHSTCSSCHAGTPGAGNVTSDKCATCHPLSGPGSCNLVDLHAPNIVGSCLNCHMNCAGGVAITTTTTSTGGATSTTTSIGGGSTTTSIAGGSTTTTTAGGSTTTPPATTVPPTTTVLPNTHMGNCLSCHLTSDLHARSAHSDCTKCHAGTPQKGNVLADKCVVCHPVGKAGECNLINLHGSSCRTCHSVAMCPATGSSTTTTSASGSSSSTTTTPATTSVTTGTHTGICLDCHFVTDLHGRSAHNNCLYCHTGTPQKGNVQADKCIMCHPVGKPGKCNLVDAHGNTCRTCHAVCAESSTTTTSIGSATTTAPPNYSHIEDCLACHKVSDLHARQGHVTCTQCHEGTPQAGNVSPGKCITCHPLGNAGKCNLITNHGSSCTACHTSCSGGGTTTSTIPNPPPTCTVTTNPASVRSGWFIPMFKQIKIQTLTGEFDETSTVSIQGFRFISISSATSTEITVLVLVPPRYLLGGLGDKTVHVITGGETCSGTLTLL